MPATTTHQGRRRAWAPPYKVAYSKGMATGVPARVVLVCTACVAVAAGSLRAQPAPEPGQGAASEATPEGAVSPPVRVRREVAVIDLATDEAAAALASRLNDLLVSHDELRPVNLTFIRSLRGPLADEEAPSLDRARRARQEADDFLGQLDYRSGELAAERGMQALHNVRPTSEVLGLYADLVFAAGQAALRQRRPNDASLAFGLAHRLDPARRPDPTQFAPDIREAYQLATSKLLISTQLEVQGTGTVWIDGIDRGVAPGTFDVSSGLHLVQLSGPERETRGAQVDVPQVPAIEIEAAPLSDERKVERTRAELARARDATARAGAMKKLALLLGVGDAVLIDKASDGTLLVQTWRDRAPGFSAQVAHRGEANPAELLWPLAPPRAPAPTPEEIIPPPPRIAEVPLYRKRWFQGAVATGILAVAATVFLVATHERFMGWDMDIKLD
jgi:hypothetical protein